MTSAEQFIAQARALAAELPHLPQDADRLVIVILAQMCVLLEARGSRGYARLAPLAMPRAPKQPPRALT